MSCYYPLKAYPGREVSAESGKRPLTFSGTKSLIEGTMYSVACGACIGCRIDRAEGWAIRAYHEARMHEFHLPDRKGSSFLTLTYDPEHLPVDNSVQLHVMQNFMKLLRYRLGPGVSVRYLLCGEYGDRKRRAHYHVLLFGYSFPDRVRYKQTRSGHWLFKSELLSLAWPYGMALIGDVTYQSARYVGGYVTKKMSADYVRPGAEDPHYWRVSPVDGQSYKVQPEFATMSNDPGLGHSWFMRFSGDVFPSDECIVDGRAHKPPRYYEKLHGEELMKPIKRERKRRAVASEADRSRARLSIMEECQVHRLNRFQREVE